MTTTTRASAKREALVRRHLVLGWAAVALGALTGLVLEALHGLKIGAYLDLDMGTRRLMWTLAHAHGTLIGLIHLGLVATVGARPSIVGAPTMAMASVTSTAALVLIPLGFALGGAWTYAGDPGLGILLVPVGGVALVLAAVSILAALGSASAE